MVKILKGMLLGSLLTLAFVAAMPVVADSFNIQFNLFRIRTATAIIADFGENFTPEFGRSAPATIYYDDKAYIQSELLELFFRGQVLWNGDTKTITLLDSDTYSGKGEIPVPTFLFYQGEDAQGMLWNYGLRRNTASGPGTGDLLLVRDVYGRNARAYGLASRTSCEFTDRGVYYAKREWRFTNSRVESLVLVELPYYNTPETQDGVEIAVVSASDVNSRIPQVILADGFMVYSEVEHLTAENAYNIYSISYENPDDIIMLAHYNPVYHYTDTAFEWLKDGYLYYYVLTSHSESASLGDRDYYKVKIDGSEEPVRLN